MLRSAKLLTEASINFKQDSAAALAELNKAVEQSPAQLAQAVERLAANTAKAAVEQATEGLVAATKSAANITEKLKNQVKAQAITIAWCALGGALIGGLAGTLGYYLLLRQVAQ